jgi:hypothetical protein
MLGRHQGAAEHKAADDRSRQGVGAPRSPVNGSCLRRHCILCRASHRPSEIDEHVQAEKREPDDRRGTVETTGDLERVSVEEPHCDSTPEQDHGRSDEQRCEQAHRRLRRSLRHIRVAVRVVAHETPPGAAQLQDDHRDQGETDEHVHRMKLCTPSRMVTTSTATGASRSRPTAAVRRSLPTGFMRSGFPRWVSEA